MGCTVSSRLAAQAVALSPPVGSAQPSSQALATVSVRVPHGARPGSVIQIKSPHGQMLQCTVPPNAWPDSIFQVQYPKPTGPSAVVDEDAKFASGAPCVAHMMPSYWTNVKMPGNSSFDQMVYVDRGRHPVFDEIFKESYFGKATRDRKCPMPVGDQCPLTPGGCACVQPGGVPGMPVGYRVRSAVRVEDSEMWGRYVEHRARVQKARGGETLETVEPRVKTDEVADKHAEVFEALDDGLNEVYLWHGTNVRTALSIAQDDFRLEFAGTNVGTMYGQGIYFAESCTKADEYATDEPGGYYHGVYAMLLCRVCLGKFQYTEERYESARDAVMAGKFDSTLGDRAKSVGTFREFVVYTPDAIYPEYVVLYSRVFQRDSAQDVARLSSQRFHMQLPVYWANTHQDPARTIFHEQYIVRRHTVALLQGLADACFKGRGKVTVMTARRIENAELWNGYTKFKEDLRRRLNGRRRSLSELDGHPESGDTLIHKFLSGNNTEDSIASNNLDEDVNEFLLWHGTSQGAADSIAQNNFRIPEGADAKHGARFGNGAYLAEDFEKALTYCKDGDNGIMYVLLCRALCGDIYYTEAHTQIDAGLKRMAEGKHSVVGNPEGVGPREFVVPEQSQVYPEYILEVKVEDWIKPEPAMMQLTKMQVTVPNGFHPGGTMQIRTPDGRVLNVRLPANAMPGSTIEISA